MSKTQSFLITPQNSIKDLLNTIGNTIATYLNWSADIDDTQYFIYPKDQLKNNTIGFILEIKDSTIFFNIKSKPLNIYCNAYPFNISYAVAVGYGPNSFYYVDIIKSNDSCSVGLRYPSDNIKLFNIIAKNEDEEYSGLFPQKDFSSWMLYLNKKISNYINLGSIGGVRYVSSDNPQTSIVKFPDIFNGCMFKDLYLVKSCPNTNQDKVFYINGKYYRFCGGYYFGFAIPES